MQKGALVRRAFERYPEHAALPIEPVSGAAPTHGYRVRAKLVWGADGSLGLFARDSHAVVDIPECRMLAPPLLRVANLVRRERGTLDLTGLDLRLVDRGVLVTLSAPPGTPLTALEQLARRLCEASGEIVGVAASFRAHDSVSVLGKGHVRLFGEEVEPHHVRASGPYHLAAHGAFVQAHLGQAERAHAAIEGALRELSARRVLELYAGSAALSLALAAAGFELTAVEAFGPALAHAERAAREQQLALHTVSGQAERVTRTLAERGERFDAVIVNPPRRGLSVDVRRALAELEPSALLYMSCSAATLARDLRHFAELGYRAQTLWPFDMIPYSDAVESLVVLRRGALPPPYVLYANAELIAIAASGYEGTTLLERVRGLPGSEQAVALAPLDEAHSGITLFARSAATLPALQTALASGAQTFIALARGVTHKKGRIRRPLNGQRRSPPPVTSYQRTALEAGHSLLKVEPDLAGARQICQHFAGIGHAILGDARYGDAPSNRFFEHRHGLDRRFLHCSAIRLARDSGSLELSCPLPADLASVLASASEPAAAHRE
jgi:23S rRNA (uracil1939-C5)-methyltransferase